METEDSYFEVAAGVCWTQPEKHLMTPTDVSAFFFKQMETF